MIGYMEYTCRNIALPLLEKGYDTVGAHVNVRHLAAAPVGVTVRFVAEIVGVEDRRVHFRVEAWAGNEKIGEGTHERGIVNVARFTARQAEKLKKS
jgi:predicted thioesterase